MLATLETLLKAGDGKMLVWNRHTPNGMEKMYKGMEMYAKRNHDENSDNNLHNNHGGYTNEFFLTWWQVILITSGGDDGAGFACVWIRTLLQILANTKILRS